MQESNQEIITKVETGNRVDGCLENPIVNHISGSIQDIKDLEKTGSVNEEDTVSNDKVMKSPESKGDHDIKQNSSPQDESCIGVSEHESDRKVDVLGCSIEEGLEKVSLVGNDGCLVVCANVMKESEVPSVGVQNDSDSDSESESESEATTSSSSSSSSSSESDDDDDDDDDEVESIEEGLELGKSNEQKVDMEEGEFMGSDTEKMVSRSDDGDDNSKVGDDEVFDDGDDDISDIPKGPIRSKNELVELPPVPPVSVTLQPDHQILPVGAVISTLGAQVVVEGSEKHSPLSEGSILWISETRSPLGLVDEIFGPVKSPFYIVRFNTESEVPSGLQIGSLIGFVQEFADHVLNDKNIYQKGYDASGENDEELMDEIEFSDDEKEDEYKRMVKMSKRGKDNQGSRNKNKKNFKNRERTWTKDQPPSTSQSQTVELSQPSQMPQYVSQANMAVPPLSGLSFPVGPTSFPEQAQQAQQAGFLLNSLLANMMQFQQQPNIPMPGSFQMNGMPWLPQNPQAQQMANLVPPQQQFDLSQLVGQVNYAGRPTMAPNTPWAGPLGSNLPNQGPSSLPSGSNQFPMFPGPMSSEPQVGPSGNSQLPTTFPMSADARPPFNQGYSSGGGRGRKPYHPRGRGSRFDSRRGRH